MIDKEQNKLDMYEFFLILLFGSMKGSVGKLYVRKEIRAVYVIYKVFTSVFIIIITVRKRSRFIVSHKYLCRDLYCYTTPKTMNKLYLL